MTKVVEHSSFLKLLLYCPAHRRVRPVLDLDPVFRASRAVGPIGSLGDDPLEPELAGLAEEVGTDLAAFEIGNEDALRPARQQPREVGLAHRERQLAQVVAVESQAVEGVELHLMIVLA